MPQLKIPKNQWEKEFTSGRWDYLDSTPIERARSAVIGMFCQQFFPAGRILDVGCGLGTLVDFLNPEQKKKYLGLDLSNEAFKRTKKKSAKFQNLDFANFTSPTKFDLIIFNEVLYYLNEKLALEKAKKLLTKNGKIIVSLYRMKGKRYDQQIWLASKKLFKTIETVEITGRTKNQSVTWQIVVWKNKIK